MKNCIFLKISRLWNGQVSKLVCFYLSILYFWKMNWSMNSFWSASILHRVSYSIRYLKEKTDGYQLHPARVRWFSTTFPGLRWRSQATRVGHLRSSGCASLTLQFWSAFPSQTRGTLLQFYSFLQLHDLVPPQSRRRWTLLMSGRQGLKLTPGSWLCTVARVLCAGGHAFAADGLFEQAWTVSCSWAQMVRLTFQPT